VLRKLILRHRAGLAGGVLLVAAVAAACASAAIGGSSSTLIAFTRQASSGRDQIIVMRADGSAQHAVTPLAADALDPAWSPDGTKLAYTGHDDELRVMNADGTHARSISRESGIGGDERPQWSPDGKRIAFDVNFGGGDKTIYIINANGTGKHSLRVQGINPAWSPDGMKLAFVNRSLHVAIVGSDGRNVRELPHTGCTLDTPSWSPSGNAIAYNPGPDCLSPNQIVVMKPDGTSGRSITKSGNFFYGSASWSPNGTMLVFSRGDSFAAIGNIYAVNADGTHVKRLTSDGHDFDPAWQR
jgi:TolB protein